jgi:large subunit ribosomal protein L23
VKDPRDIIFRPVISEKTYGLLDENKYTFIVDPRSNKTQIKQAIEQIFEVKVVSVNTMNRPGKKKRRGFIVGKRPDTKRAIVTLAPGDEIELFEAGI